MSHICTIYENEIYTNNYLYSEIAFKLFAYMQNIACMATVKTETNTSSYVGMTGNNFKTRYYNYIKSFKNKRYKNETELSKNIWKPKEKEVEHTITWRKLR